MTSLAFVTGNPGKARTTNAALAAVGVAVEQIKLPLIEIQADDVRDFAIDKARQAFKQLQRPVLINDGCFAIKALNGFPGPYAAYALKTLSNDDILRMMAPHTDRSAWFESVYVLIEVDGREHVFQSFTRGRLTDVVHDVNNPLNWSEYWKIFIPNGFDKPLCHFTAADIERIGDYQESNALRAVVTFFKTRAAA